MPCDSIETSKVEFLANSTDTKLLARGLRAHGYTVNEHSNGLQIGRSGQWGSYDKRSGRLEVPETWDTQEFKRAYSEEVVTSEAAEHGWQLEWRTNEAGNREAEVTKRV